jgi:prolyl 4-hydroxylase
MNLSEPVPDQAALARLGAQVSARLVANPDVLAVAAPGLELFAIGGFLGNAECESLIAMIDAIAKPSALHELDYASGYRTSYSGDLDPSDPMVASISRRIDALLGIDAANGEPLQGQRYLPGQEYKPHNDWFYTSEGYWPQEDARGGQRSWTAMAYCNDVAAGGATAFVAAGLRIEPRRGALLVWNNALPGGQPNEGTLHAGLPVERGGKYIVTKWYRARQWG